MRFWKVAFQTVAAPVLTAVMYLLIFGHVLSDKVQVFDQIGYTRFLIPGLVMMSVLQNAFANSSSSLIQSKITGNLVFLLVTPLSHWAWFVAYVGASMVRGLASARRGRRHRLVRAARPGAAAVDVVFAAARAPASWARSWAWWPGLWAEKFDQMAAFQNFIIMPMTFLSGVFYSGAFAARRSGIQVSHLNPFFYMIDGFRRGFFGASDVSPWLSLAVVGAASSSSPACAETCCHRLQAAALNAPARWTPPWHAGDEKRSTGSAAVGAQRRRFLIRDRRQSCPTAAIALPPGAGVADPMGA